MAQLGGESRPWMTDYISTTFLFDRLGWVLLLLHHLQYDFVMEDEMTTY